MVLPVVVAAISTIGVGGVLGLDDRLHDAGRTMISAATLAFAVAPPGWSPGRCTRCLVLQRLIRAFGADAEELDEEAVLELVGQARAGDRVARQRLYRQYVARVFRTVRGTLRSDAEAEDVTQDAMLTALTSLDRYSPRSGTRFVAWLTTIAINTMRRRFRRRRPELTATGELPDVPAADDDLGDDIDRSAAAQSVAAGAGGARAAGARDREPALWRRAQRHGDLCTSRGRARQRAQDSRESACSTRRAHRSPHAIKRSSSMNDAELIATWSMLEPSARRRARIETRVFEWLEASETSLLGEWLGLLKVEPLTGLAYVSVGALSLVLLTPVGWIVSALL